MTHPEALAERERIAAWHRRQAVLCGACADAAVDKAVKLGEVQKARLHAMSASCIERGAHLKGTPDDR